MKKLMNWLKNEESGQGMVEYGLIIALVAIVAIAGLTLLGPKLSTMFTNVSNKITG
jgi:pilus assembly protein Flp/PilA